MDIALISYGSRGDVQPFVALARALRHIGHHVRLVAPPNFTALVAEYGVDFAPAGADLEAHLRERIKTLPQSSNAIRLLQRLRDELQSLILDAAHDTWRACQGADVVIGTGPGPASVAEKLDAPLIEVALQPVTPTHAFPSPVAPPWLRLGGGYNRLTHLAFEQLFWQLFRGNTNLLRDKALGLPPYSWAGPLRRLREHGLLRLYAYSALVVPRPEDWPAHHQVTGYWFLPPPPGWEPPAELASFLEAGPPPVYIGFGSMMTREPQRITSLVLEALRRSGQRGVIAGGWGALDQSMLQSERVCFVDSVPHHWLFPRVAAVVHHGGAGTTGAALRGGVPSIVVPFGFDQPFWATRAATLGVAPPPLPRKALTEQKLASAVERAVTDARMRERASQLGAQLQAEHGTARALEQIHRTLRGVAR